MKQKKQGGDILDFLNVAILNSGKKTVTITPEFRVDTRSDLMTRGGHFYAIWNEFTGFWDTNIGASVKIIDSEVRRKKDEYLNSLEGSDETPSIKIISASNFSTQKWKEYNQYIRLLADEYHPLNDKILFTNSPRSKSDYASKTLPYAINEGSIDAFDKIIGTLYDEEDRKKIEWAIGSIISGDSTWIQKFIVMYGEPGTGKSTILRIIEMLFQGYVATFDGKALVSSSNQFAFDAFSSNPLVAIQHDGDLSKIEDNSRLNSLVSHETILINEKHKSPYQMTPHSFLFMGTNSPVKISDGKSGILRRLIDVNVSGRKLPQNVYYKLMEQVKFELGAIAYHCLQVYESMGPGYYDAYVPYSMIFKTNTFYNFMEENYFFFKEQPYVTLKQVYTMYKQYVSDSGLQYSMNRIAVREELKNYFGKYVLHGRVDGQLLRNWYTDFLESKFNGENIDKLDNTGNICLIFDKNSDTILRDALKDSPAQIATENGIPSKKWANVKTKLSDINSKELHYVKLPENHIVIDFDLKDSNGNKSKDLNLEAAAKFPETYGEFSKSGEGVHLHYIYDGDVNKLSGLYSEGIEIKVFTGNSSLRRRFTYGNNLPISHINSGLPLRESGDRKMINENRVKSERSLRELILKNLRKEIHPSTTQSVNFIFEILENAYNDGFHYDVSDMRGKVLAFANNSTHQSENCIRKVSKMKFHSSDQDEGLKWSDEAPIVFYDIEVFPNLFVICWKLAGKDKKVVRMIQPKASDILKLMECRLIGFNNRRYDNHILYGAVSGACNQNGDSKGYSNMSLFELSEKIINLGVTDYGFLEAYNISYTDIYDFASAGHKQSLKKFEIEMGIHHQEFGLPWDQPVPEDRWDEVADYCSNDVIASEATFHYLKSDWLARQILAELSGLSVNHTTNQHSTKIIFGDNKHPQNSFYYRDLSEPVQNITPEMEDFLKARTSLDLSFDPYDGGPISILPYFPGYKYENGISTYRGFETGEGGLVIAKPGMYSNVALLDVESMHPTSVEDEFLFGEYTWRFSDIKNSRTSIKHEDEERLSEYLNGVLVKFYERVKNGEFSADDLSTAMKTVINSVYGLTSARFDNAFRDHRNIDNIVAKRGALFMIDLKYAVESRGFVVCHIKTDSIKIPNATPEIIEFVKEFGKKYGYKFEHEATYDRMCLVNNAVYIAKYDSYGIRNKHGKHANEWTATGAQFAHPYIFKTMFSGEKLEFRDYCETKSVKTAIYLDYNEDLPENEHSYTFVGKVGLFVPVKDGCGGGVLVCKRGDNKYDAVTGSSGYKWLEAEMLSSDENWIDKIDMSYYRDLYDKAADNISKYGNIDWFVSEDAVPPYNSVDSPPWLMPCGRFDCQGCEYFYEDDGGVIHCQKGFSPLPF